MSPTLDRQDPLLVDKPLSSAGEPALGDIVMMRYPVDPERSFVMRVIAAGGDEVRIVDGVVFRNGSRIDEPYVMEASRGNADWGPEVVPGDTYLSWATRALSVRTAGSGAACRASTSWDE
jgi:signal peptidase I